MKETTASLRTTQTCIINIINELKDIATLGSLTCGEQVIQLNLHFQHWPDGRYYFVGPRCWSSPIRSQESWWSLLSAYRLLKQLVRGDQREATRCEHVHDESFLLGSSRTAWSLALAFSARV